MKSLYSRVFLITICTVLFSSLFAFLISNIYYHIKLKPYNDEKLTSITETIQQYAEKHPEDLTEYLQNSAALGYEMYLVDAKGNGRFFGSPFRNANLPQEIIASVLAGEIYHGVAQFPNKPFITGFFDNRLTNTIGVPIRGDGAVYALFLRPDVLLQFGELRIFFALIGALTVFCSLVFFLFSTRFIVKPITRLTEATQEMAEGRFHNKLPERRKDEIGQLAVHFAKMSRELERAELARQQFVANVSHEIQSPLTSIQGFAQVLADSELPDEEQRRYAEVIAQESRRLSRLGKELLTLSAIEQGKEGLHVRRFSLKAQLREALQVLEWQLEQKELAVSLSVPDRMELEGDDVLLMQVWMNLLGNAIQHIPAGRSIQVKAEKEPSRNVIRIADTGEGIAPEHLPFLFDRFYRVDPARERESGNTGLGLSIAMKIVRLHGGTLDVESRLGEGTVFTVILPQL
ncbi:sensor histidine kinase [Gorillibacterium timonense]|uniref:sensor histidine kinase n=1 Tax=Gorillibacterium timonense TaxID=1689269 RepID=UPI00071CB0DB|nr:HAMP domain-containing sensor histidine kinase [Gorillibacterium timonense]